MKRHSLSTFLISLLYAATLCGAPVTRSDALLSAQSFLESRGLPASAIILSSTRSSSEAPEDAPYHIFNVAGNGGFVIIAGDDRARTVLGYSLSGNLDPDNLPEPCVYWLRQYASEIQSLSGTSTYINPLFSINNDSETVDYPDTPVEPLLKSKWDQNAPYNLECPKDTEGRPYATGCVATATAQIMFYYRYPERATGSVTYEDKAVGTLRTLDFADYPTFKWDAMTDTYDINSSTKSCLAVASLMKAVGYASKMQYGTTSIAYSTTAAKALVDNFGYDPNIHKYERALISDDEWAQLIFSELYTGRPVLYDGFNQEGGHTFVCDGYDGKGFFHFNWGWGGLSDGYYSLSALDPSHQATGGTTSGYNLHQIIICGIAPPGKFSSQPQTEGLLDMLSLHFHSENGYTIAGDDTTVTSEPNEALLFIYAYNKGLSELYGDACMAIIDDDNITPVYTATIYFLNPNERVGLRFWPLYSTLPDGSPLPTGSYRMGFFYRPYGDDSWHPMRTSYGTPTECNLTIEPECIVMSTSGISGDTAVATIEVGLPHVEIEAGRIRVTSHSLISAVAVYDLTGKLCHRTETTGYETTIHTDLLSQGTYIINILTADGRASAVKVRI